MAGLLGPNGNVGQRTIPTEPMAMIMNFGMSNGFSRAQSYGFGSTTTGNHAFRLRKDIPGSGQDQHGL